MTGRGVSPSLWAPSGTAVAPGPAASVAVALRAGAQRLARAGVPTARQDAELLLARTLGTTRLALYVEPGRPLLAPERRRFAALLARRLAHEPLQYLLGVTAFCGLELAVGPGVFIPRPETEDLVTRALAALPAGPVLAVDLCTGSGAVACALAARRADVAVTAVEREPAAARWARRNVARLALGGRVTVLEGDLFAALPGAGGRRARRLDLVVSNPPYLAGPTLPTLPREVRDWEPAAALDGGPGGTTVLARIVDEAPGWLRPGGALCLEIGEDQATWLAARVARDARYRGVTVHRDFRGAPRIALARTEVPG